MSTSSLQPEINLGKIRHWLLTCRTLHGGCCNDRYTELLAEQLDTLNLVDVNTLSIVTLPSSTPFVALSYVWGDVDVCKATRSNLASLQQKGALSGTTTGIVIPNTIRDAIHLTKELNERYLWVDCLCILQDAGPEEMSRTLRAMARIYAAAELTIVDAGGDNADHGLRGIGEPSIPRTDADIPEHGNQGYPWNSKWASRGWTFQEGLFARRLLVFEGSVNWICGRYMWQEKEESIPWRIRAIQRKMKMVKDPKYENVYEIPGVRGGQEVTHERLHLGVPMGMMSLLPQLPNLGRWGMLVQNFAMRTVSYEHDFGSAFVGATEIMGATFPGGIFHGLPEFFFDIALLWQPNELLPRRGLETPSWSWTGWKGPVDCLLPWHMFFAGVYRRDGDVLDWVTMAPLKRTAQFHKLSVLTNEPIPIKNDFYEFQTVRGDANAVLPEGWTRHEHPEGHYYRWDREPSENARYGFPLPVAGRKPLSSDDAGGMKSEAVPESEPAFSQVLQVKCPSLQVRTANDSVSDKGGSIFTSLIDPKGRIIGYLAHGRADLTPGTSCPLLAISEAEVVQPERLAQEMSDVYRLEWDVGLWEQDLVREGELMGFYNVLWVSREGDSVQREGIGKVGKRFWDSLNPEMITVNLG